MKENQEIERILNKLATSSFRSKFHLKEIDQKQIQSKGYAKIQEHAEVFIHNRLAPSVIPNDGKQTPMKGHPVFIAQHATACCCRECLQKWHHIPKGKELTKEEETQIVKLIMTWIKKEMDHGTSNKTNQ